LGISAGFAKEPMDMRERVVMMRNWQLMDEFDLSRQKAEKVFAILDRFDKERAELLKNRRNLMKKLRRMVDGDSGTPGEINDLLKQISRINVDIAAISGKEVDALSEVFSPKEQARYLLFMDRFAKNMRHIMKKQDERNRPAKRSGRERIW
jgi:hypothetical protein